MAFAAANYPEALLQYAWQHRRFDAKSLLTTDRQPVTVIKTGTLNRDAGPDFLNATVRIGKLEFHGHVELHIRGDDWHTHRHQHDAAYNPVVLHVVAKPSTRPPQRADGTVIPEVVLGDRLDANLLTYYGKLIANENPIACASFFPEVDAMATRMWVTSLSHQRLLSKALQFEADWETARRDWRQALWVAIAGALGGPLNRGAFEQVARQVTYSVAATHRTQPLALEAMLLGAAGLLQEVSDDFTAQLAAHWQHYQRLLTLAPLNEGQLTFGRMRPASFPSMRLAQWAALARQPLDWLGLLTTPTDELRNWLKADPDPYFRAHYRLGVPSKVHSAALGDAQVWHLLINTLVPFAMFYHRQRGDQPAVEAAADRLAHVPTERNHVTAVYTSLGFKPEHALDSQGLIELHRNYCTPKHCLRCTVGHHILKRSS